MNSVSRLLTVTDLCDLLHIKHTNAYAKIRTKEIKSYKIGKKILIREEDIQEYLKSCINN